MKTPYRLELAIKKLYTAFHSNTLNPECCTRCAVGNILDNKDYWKHLTDVHGSVKLNYVGKVNEIFGKKFNGYSPQELLKIEAEFLKACGFALPLVRNSKRPNNIKDKDILFNGLCATIAYLCNLDCVSNVMDYSKLFEFEDNKPVNQLIMPTS